MPILLILPIQDTKETGNNMNFVNLARYRNIGGNKQGAVMIWITETVMEWDHQACMNKVKAMKSNSKNLPYKTQYDHVLKQKNVILEDPADDGIPPNRSTASTADSPYHSVCNVENLPFPAKKSRPL